MATVCHRTLWASQIRRTSLWCLKIRLIKWCMSQQLQAVRIHLYQPICQKGKLWWCKRSGWWLQSSLNHLIKDGSWTHGRCSHLDLSNSKVSQVSETEWEVLEAWREADHRKRTIRSKFLCWLSSCKASTIRCRFHRQWRHKEKTIKVLYCSSFAVLFESAFQFWTFRRSTSRSSKELRCS